MSAMTWQEAQRMPTAELRRRLAAIQAKAWEARTESDDEEWEVLDRELWQREQDRIERARFQEDTPCLPDPWWRNP